MWRSGTACATWRGPASALCSCQIRCETIKSACCFDRQLLCFPQVGADLCMGSLIKSPGGTLATTGGYIAGRADLIAAAGARLTAPGVGLDAGAVPSETLRLMFQGTSDQQGFSASTWLF